MLSLDNFFEPPNEVTWANGRLPSRTYVSKTFILSIGRDAGEKARYIHKVFDEITTDDDDNWEWTEHVVYKTPAGRKQIELNVAREAGVIRKIRIQKTPTSGDMTKLEPVLELDRSQSEKLIDLVKSLDSIPIDGDSAVYVDDTLLRDIFSDPTAMGRAYGEDPDRFRALIQSDAKAEDVIALRRRREVVATMREWIEDDDAFDIAKAAHGGPERAWQKLLEENPWVLGIGLGGQMFTSWDSRQLEKVVSGHNLRSPGKRVDALLRSNGIVRALAFAEIKHHRTDLLADEYRPGVWKPSAQLSGAVVQVQQTVRMALRDLGEYLEDREADGSRTGSGTFLVRPRSFLIIGTLGQVLGDGGGPIDDKVHSFELFRRNLQEPEIITFDELLARAEWHVELAEQRSEGQ